MKKIHFPSLKFHTIYSITLAIVFLIILLFVRDIALGVAMILLVIYVVGNGIIHTKKSELKRDTLLEYIIVAVIALIIIAGAF